MKNVQWSEARVQHVVEQHMAEGAEGRNGRLGKREQPQAALRRSAIGQVAAAEMPEAEARHEGGNHQRRRIDVAAREQHEQPLPDNLVEQRGGSRQHEDPAGGSLRQQGGYSLLQPGSDPSGTQCER
jgi:hypothetical protein